MKQNALTDRVRLMGEEDDVKNIYANTSGVLISSDREGSPKVLFEALFCNIPVISTGVGIMPDLLPNSCLSEATDESFKDLLETTIPNIDEIRETSTTLFNEVKNKFTLKNQNGRVEEIYRTLLSKASR
jgi:glycosyltransferase involved in cell wall biosynthesis